MTLVAIVRKIKTAVGCQKWRRLVPYSDLYTESLVECSNGDFEGKFLSHLLWTIHHSNSTSRWFSITSMASRVAAKWI